MSVLNRDQRATVRITTLVDPLIIDRVSDAYDCLLRDDVEGYYTHMMTAFAQQNLPTPIPEEERPTAIDKVKTIIIKAVADDKHWSFRRTARFLEEAAKKK